ncbi:MAG TPA: GAF domain-containing protein [Thermomicrobiaceae bacterium]|nr:GAF domain-containing protein [Thermomicrobiaceae bacterium]
MDAITGHARTAGAEDREIVQPELFALLQRMTARLRSAAPLGELLSGLAASICGALETEIGLVRLFDRDHERLSVQGSHGVPPHLLGGLLGERSRALAEFLALRPGSLISYTPDRPLVLQHATIIDTAEVQELQQLGALHMLILPLHHRGELVGRLDLLRLRDVPFSTVEGALATTLGTLVAGAIFGPAHPDPGERYDRIIEASFAFQQSIAPLANVGEMLQSIVEAAGRVVPCDRCYGLLWDGTRASFAPVAVAGADPAIIAQLKRLSFSFTPRDIPALAEVLGTDRPLVVTAGQDKRLPDWLAEALGVHRLALVPLRSRRETLIGVLMLDTVSPERDFSQRDLAVLSVIAPHAAMLVEHALLYEEVKRSSDRLALVNDIGIELASLTDLEHLFRQVRLHVASVMTTSRFCLGLVLPDGESIEYRYALEDDLGQEPITRPLGNDPMSRAIRTRQPILLETRESGDLSDWFPLEQEPRSESMLAVPVQVGHRAIGVIAAFSEICNAYTQNDLDLLATVGLQAGVAIENARLYTLVQARGERRAYLLDQMLSRHEAERKTIAADIHNDTLQTLASSLYSLDLISRRAVEQNPLETQGELREVRDNLAENIDRLRQITFQIRPSTLDILGLEPALREHARYIERSADISISIEVDLFERLSNEVETAVYRIVQEAIDEVRGRTGVSYIVIRIKQVGELIIATLADNGESVSLDTVDEGTADLRPLSPAVRRLVALRERIELAGGHLHTANLPGGGTTLQLVLPNRGNA